MPAKKGLGRGLSALIKDGTTEKKQAQAKAAPEAKGGATMVPIDKIKRNPMQPRKRFDEEAIKDLSESIKVHGVIQPLLVRKDKDSYELIAGERRLRASGVAGLKQVPVIAIEVDDKESLELALIENLQRENLDALEEAEGYQALIDKFGLTQDETAKRVGKARVSVTNSLRLLSLPEEIKALLSKGEISSGHAKVLLGLEKETDMLMLAKRVVKEGLSVREIEKAAKKTKRMPKKPRATRSDIPKAHLDLIVNTMHTHFGTSVRVSPTQTFANGKKKKGVIEIDFFSNEDLDRILTMLDISLD